MIKTEGSGIAKMFSFGAKKTPKEKEEESSTSFARYRTQLEQRIAVVEQGLSSTGVRLVQLGTEELIELFYKTFNPGDLEKPIKLD